MKPLQILLASAAKSDRKIVLSEGADPRIVQAEIDARKQNVARIILVGDEAAVSKQLAQAGGTDLAGIEIFDPEPRLATMNLPRNIIHCASTRALPCKMRRGPCVNRMLRQPYWSGWDWRMV